MPGVIELRKIYMFSFFLYFRTKIFATEYRHGNEGSYNVVKKLLEYYSGLGKPLQITNTS